MPAYDKTSHDQPRVNSDDRPVTRSQLEALECRVTALELAAVLAAADLQSNTGEDKASTTTTTTITITANDDQDDDKEDHYDADESDDGECGKDEDEDDEEEEEEEDAECSYCCAPSMSPADTESGGDSRDVDAAMAALEARMTRKYDAAFAELNTTLDETLAIMKDNQAMLEKCFGMLNEMAGVLDQMPGVVKLGGLRWRGIHYRGDDV